MVSHLPRVGRRALVEVLLPQVLQLGAERRDLGLVLQAHLGKLGIVGLEDKPSSRGTTSLHHTTTRVSRDEVKHFSAALQPHLQLLVSGLQGGLLLSDQLLQLGDQLLRLAEPLLKLCWVWLPAGPLCRPRGRAWGLGGEMGHGSGSLAKSSPL